MSDNITENQKSMLKKAEAYIRECRADVHPISDADCRNILTNILSFFNSIKKDE